MTYLKSMLRYVATYRSVVRTREWQRIVGRILSSILPDMGNMSQQSHSACVAQDLFCDIGALLQSFDPVASTRRRAFSVASATPRWAFTIGSAGSISAPTQARWRDARDHRHRSNGEQYLSMTSAALKHPMSKKWRGYYPSDFGGLNVQREHVGFGTRQPFKSVLHGHYLYAIGKRLGEQHRRLTQGETEPGTDFLAQAQAVFGSIKLEKTISVDPDSPSHESRFRYRLLTVQIL